MKTPEILLACLLISGVAGVGASLATRAFSGTPARTEGESRSTAREPTAAANGAAPADAHALDELRMANAALQERVTTLEGRLSAALGARTPVQSEPSALQAEVLGTENSAASASALLTALDSSEVTPGFVNSVSKALDTIKAKEAAEREQKRKEQQAQRIEDKVTQLQQDLGLSGRQASDLRTALITQEDKRDALFASMRDESGNVSGDPREMRESFRTLRDETYATLQTILNPTQFEAFKQKDEQDWGKRGEFGRGPGRAGPDGAQGAPGFGGGGGFSGRGGR